MSEKPAWSLETHRAENVKQAAALAATGDIGGPLEYLLEHPEDRKAFCEKLQTEAPRSSFEILGRMVKLLLMNARPTPAPPDLKTALQALIERKPEQAAAYLRAHPDEIEAFFWQVIGIVGSVRTGFALAKDFFGGKGLRDHFDLMTELLDFLIEQNAGNVAEVRSRIQTLLDATEWNDNDEALREVLANEAPFILEGAKVAGRVLFVSRAAKGREHEPEPIEFLSNVRVESEDPAALERSAAVFRHAGISISVITAPVNDPPVNVPGYFTVPRDSINQAIKQGHLSFARRAPDDPHDMTYELKASSVVRAARLEMRVVR